MTPFSREYGGENKKSTDPVSISTEGQKVESAFKQFPTDPRYRVAISKHIEVFLDMDKEEDFAQLTLGNVVERYYNRLSLYGKILYHIELNTYKIMLLLFLSGVLLGRYLPI